MKTRKLILDVLKGIVLIIAIYIGIIGGCWVANKLPGTAKLIMFLLLTIFALVAALVVGVNLARITEDWLEKNKKDEFKEDESLE